MKLVGPDEPTEPALLRLWQVEEIPVDHHRPFPKQRFDHEFHGPPEQDSDSAEIGNTGDDASLFQARDMTLRYTEQVCTVGLAEARFLAGVGQALREVFHKDQMN